VLTKLNKLKYHYFAAIFRKSQTLTPAFNLRFVAINRRHYPGSTPLSDEDVAVIQNVNGPDDVKTAFMRERGQEILSFIDAFIRTEDLPPISGEGSSGGIAILGWSAGCYFLTAAIAHIDTLELAAQERFRSYMRSTIMLGMYLIPIMGRRSWMSRRTTFRQYASAF
jgi:hypothetical protein